jgi:hypothetical protein
MSSFRRWKSPNYEKFLGFSLLVSRKSPLLWAFSRATTAARAVGRSRSLSLGRDSFLHTSRLSGAVNRDQFSNERRENQEEFVPVKILRMGSKT